MPLRTGQLASELRLPSGNGGVRSGGNVSSRRRPRTTGACGPATALSFGNPARWALAGGSSAEGSPGSVPATRLAPAPRSCWFSSRPSTAARRLRAARGRLAVIANERPDLFLDADPRLISRARVGDRCHDQGLLYGE